MANRAISSIEPPTRTPMFCLAPFFSHKRMTARRGWGPQHWARPRANEQARLAANPCKYLELASIASIFLRLGLDISECYYLCDALGFGDDCNHRQPYIYSAPCPTNSPLSSNEFFSLSFLSKYSLPPALNCQVLHRLTCFFFYKNVD